MSQDATITCLFLKCDTNSHVQPSSCHRCHCIRSAFGYLFFYWLQSHTRSTQ